MRLIALLIAVALAHAADPLAKVFDHAVAALSAGNYTAAEAGFQQVLKSQPNHIGALGNLGVVYARTAQWNKSVDIYRRALRLVPNDKGLLLNLGLAYVKQESWTEALPVFQTLVKTDPASPQARTLLATTQLHTGQIAAAIAAFETLRDRDPGVLYLLGVAYLKQNQPEKGRETLQAFLSTAPPAQAALVLCKAHYESERFAEAAAFCRTALEAESDPAVSGAHRELGKVLLSLRSPDASKELAAAVQQDPADSEAAYFLGAALLQEDRVPEAIRHLERARELKPNFWGSYFYLAKARPAEAIPLLQKAAELNPSESAIFYQLGRALTAAGRPAEAAAAMQRVRELKAQGLAEETKTLQKH